MPPRSATTQAARLAYDFAPFEQAADAPGFDLSVPYVDRPVSFGHGISLDDSDVGTGFATLRVR